jgi:transcription elongation factor Elf1
LYRLKADVARTGEPAHFICPNCKDVLNKLSILQEDGNAAYCKNKDCGQVFDIAAQPTFQRQYHNPYAV